MHSTSSWFQKNTLHPCYSERRTQSSIGCNLDGLELQFPSESLLFWNPLESTDCSYCSASTRLPSSRPSGRYEDALATLRDSCSLQKRQWFGCSLGPQTAVQLGCPRSFLKQKVIRANVTRSQKVRICCHVSFILNLSQGSGKKCFRKWGEDKSIKLRQISSAFDWTCSCGKWRLANTPRLGCQTAKRKHKVHRQFRTGVDHQFSLK